jgi:hypothetical protein
MSKGSLRATGPVAAPEVLLINGEVKAVAPVLFTDDAGDEHGVLDRAG